MRGAIAAVLAGLVVTGCGGPQSAATSSERALTNASPSAVAVDTPMAAPEPPYLQLNVEPFLLDTDPTAARVGVFATTSEHVSALWSDLTFDPDALFVADVDGRPDCVLAGGAVAAEFSFLPAGCRGGDCQRVHAVVTPADPDGSGMLYSCRVTGQGTAHIALEAAGSGLDGSPFEVVTEAARLAWNGPVQLLASDRIDPATSAGEITVSLDAGDSIVAGTQNDLTLDGDAAFLARESGRPDCVVNPAIDKPFASFAFQPPGAAGLRHSAIRAIVFSVSDAEPIPNGAWLYACRIASNRPLSAAFSRCLASTPMGDVVLVSGRTTFGD